MGQEVLRTFQQVSSAASAQKGGGGQRATGSVAEEGGEAPGIMIYTLGPETEPGMPSGGSTLPPHLRKKEGEGDKGREEEKEGGREIQEQS